MDDDDPPNTISAGVAPIVKVVMWCYIVYVVCLCVPRKVMVTRLLLCQKMLLPFGRLVLY